MTFPNSQRNREADSGPDAEENAQFMLAELLDARELLRLFMNRFENLITLYLAGMAATLSAVAAVSALEQPAMISRTYLALLGCGAYVFSIVIYVRLCITRILMTEKVARERLAQRYFLDRQEKLRKYLIWTQPLRGVSDVRVDIELGKWMFARRTVTLFYALALFTALLSSATSVTTTATIFEFSGIPTWHYSIFHLGWYLIGTVGPFSLTMLLCVLTLRSSRKEAQRIANRALRVPPESEQL